MVLKKRKKEQKRIYTVPMILYIYVFCYFLLTDIIKKCHKTEELGTNKNIHFTRHSTMIFNEFLQLQLIRF